MSTTPTGLKDDEARATAMTALGRSLLVEAGAGSGKTAVMAGRVAMLLADGAAPGAIAAVTFTELAAGELIRRVRAFVDALVAGAIPPELAVALPHGLDARQRTNLAAAAAVIDQLTCTTIHGFCQRLISPYPVEANIDPGAAVMERDHADQVFNELADQWLWAELDGSGDSLVAQLVAADPKGGIGLVRQVVGQLRAQRALTTAAVAPLAPLLHDFVLASTGLDAFLAASGVQEEEAQLRSRCFGLMAQEAVRLAGIEGNAALVQLQRYRAHGDLCTKQGSFRKFQAKGNWETAAKAAGMSKAERGDSYVRLSALVAACEAAWCGFEQEVAASVLAQLVVTLRPLATRFQDYKRNAALLDFDDLIHSARALLRDHEPVRRALGARYLHVLVDEFQDTDPLQTEILWRLCGDRPPGSGTGDWRGFAIRPGALFLVGDPKQAIYRFRGADIGAYTAARQVFAQGANVLSIATNFRSRAPILDFVNQRFETRLSADGQPGFTRLDAFHEVTQGSLCVAALDVAVEAAGKPSAEQQRDAEAEAVAEMCSRLIGSTLLGDRQGCSARPCSAGDIALLAPTGKDLWRYEEALEKRGIAVATQAGKGFYRRQEVQDLIAVTRVLADSRDTIALGALLRGPLVGLTEEELLDIVAALPSADPASDRLPRLSIRTDAQQVQNAVARDLLQQLQSLRRQARSTSPHLLLAQAVEMLQVRPILLQRHGGRAERALANVDKFLSLSQAYAVQGLKAFADAMTLAWTDESRAPEGQPDAQEDAVTLYTMHAAKGLEWPVVVPINTMTRTMAADTVFCERASQRLCCPVFGVQPTGYAAHRQSEVQELGHEHVRLWYVAATRAREMLVLPRLDVDPDSAAWMSLLDLGLRDLSALTLDPCAPLRSGQGGSANDQTREQFGMEAAIVAAAGQSLRWRSPSRSASDSADIVFHQGTTDGLGEGSAPPALAPLVESGAPDDADDGNAVQGGLLRGLVMHKLFEEVLTGETGDEAGVLDARATVLIAQVDPSPQTGTSTLSASEIAACVVRTLGLPEIALLRPGLLPEFPVYAAAAGPDRAELITVGVADAISFSASGQPEVVIDWKSDVDPSEATLHHYQQQVGDYLKVTGAARGLIVLATSGRVIEIAHAPGEAAAPAHR